jgi:hypothetical protein
MATRLRRSRRQASAHRLTGRDAEADGQEQSQQAQARRVAKAALPEAQALGRLEEHILHAAAALAERRPQLIVESPG